MGNILKTIMSDVPARAVADEESIKKRQCPEHHFFMNISHNVPGGGGCTRPRFVRGCAHDKNFFHPAPEFLPSNDTLF